MILGMSLDIIISQTLAVICNTYITFTKRQKNIYVANFLFNLFCLITGLFQKDYALCVSYCITIYRAVLLIYKNKLKEKMNWFPLTFILAHVIFGIATWTDWWCIIPIFVPIMTGCILWYSDDLQLYRVNNIVNNSLWITHNLHSNSYILILTRLYTIVINMLVLIKYRISSDFKA